jgi:hypothetical protein
MGTLVLLKNARYIITIRLTAAVIRKVIIEPKLTQSKPQRLLAINAQIL